MLFRTFIGALVLTAACGPKTNEKQGYIGNKLDDPTSLYNGYGIQSNSIFLVDTPTHRILNVDLGALTVSQTYALSKPDYEHTLAASYDGSYVIDFSTKHLEVIKSGGEREDRPFAFQGTPISAAYHPTKGILVMQDDHQSIGLMILSADGKISKSWLGGSLFDQGKSLLAGDVDSSGRLVLATSDNSAVIIDIEKSIDQGAWSFDSFVSSIDKVHWIAPDNGHSDLSLVLAKDTVAIFNVRLKTVAERLPLLENKLTVLGQSKWVKPHIIVSNSSSGRESVYFIDQDGNLASHELPKSDMGGYTVSYLDAEAAELTILYSIENFHRVTKLRMSDNLVVLDNVIQSQGDAQLGLDVLFINKKSHLGYLETHDLRSSAVKELKGFNFDYFRSN